MEGNNSVLWHYNYGSINNFSSTIYTFIENQISWAKEEPFLRQGVDFWNKL
jgi:hypothetical protein